MTEAQVKLLQRLAEHTGCNCGDWSCFSDKEEAEIQKAVADLAKFVNARKYKVVASWPDYSRLQIIAVSEYGEVFGLPVLVSDQVTGVEWLSIAGPIRRSFPHSSHIANNRIVTP